MCVRHEEDSAMVEELWFLSRRAAGCISFGVEQRYMTALASVVSCWFLS